MRAERKTVSAAVLKHTALVLMFICHLSVCRHLNGAGPAEWFYNFQWYLTRPAFVLFAFLLSEGMLHTRDRRKYLLRLLGAAVLSEYFYDIMLGGCFPYWGSQNILFTLFLGALTICLLDRYKSRPAVAAVFTVLILAFASLTRIDYGFMGIALILVFYYLREKKALKYVAAGAVLFVLWFAQRLMYDLQASSTPDLTVCLHSALQEAHGMLAFPLLAIYNGEKGRQLPQWFYYLFYPGHLAVILLVTRLFF